MSPTGDGWFWDFEERELLPIWEHMSAVLRNPARYRVTAKEVEGKSRKEVLSLVFRRGFMRIRAERTEVHFEFNRPRGEALSAIRSLLGHLSVGPQTWLIISDHHRRESVVCFPKRLSRPAELEWKSFGHAG